jgi:hypothetical protein
MVTGRFSGNDEARPEGRASCDSTGVDEDT